MMPNEWLVEMSTSALEHADQIQRWWKAERPAAPYLFREELAAACSRLAQAPRPGAEYFRAGEPPMRRLLLHRTGYHVFYAVNEADRRVTIQAIWHARRGRGPSFVRERAPRMAWRGGARPAIRRRSPAVFRLRDAPRATAAAQVARNTG